ncbi:hamartin isoform X2 [Schistocerca americana]|uniref:hamartin isoform X2 n=1 Tax=Schistocerca americana TaxID=7009 RepID=UPI001F4F690F|nr:hamartin isoform X2 [Schistocerca americana]XP_049959850.1 hamartin isoform X2 [Schistocerca serialis cubense]
MADIVELFNRLESNQPEVVEEVKKTIHDIFNSTKESFMVNGLFEYYLTTSSVRSAEILAGVREPHDKHIFDKISESMKGSLKLQALTLLGHIIKRHPTWIFKITNHSLFKDILKLLKVETDILPLMSALLVLIVLLPMIPALLGPHLQDIFEVFSRLAAWNTNNPNKLPAEHLLHLQISLYFLFHRLYGMYPCNFLGYLRSQYSQRDNLVVFSHTIKPMLDTVKMHPLLVTATKDAETAATRWKNMEDHDVIMECAKFGIDPQERNWDSLSSSFRSRGSAEHADSTLLKSAFTPLSVRHPPTENEFWSPSACFGLSTPPPQESAPASIPQTPNSQGHVNASVPPHEGTSPPEAAVEATPETTPVKAATETVQRESQAPVRARSPLSGRTSPSQRNGFKFDQDASQEDQEVLEIVRLGENLTIGTQPKVMERECDSVLEDVVSSGGHVGEYEECGQEGGAECAAGGLHMPSSRSMLEMVRRIQQQRHHRHRFYSQSVVSDGIVDSVGGMSALTADGEVQVRRANSCPEMEKGPLGSGSSVGDAPDERDELVEEEGFGSVQRSVSIGTQTIDRWAPLPYEHLFCGVMDSHEKEESTDVSATVPTSASLHNSDPAASSYALVDKYIECLQLQREASKVSSLSVLEYELKTVKEQLALLNIQLHFERHRREIHAERNRRLLGKSRTNRALEEYNIALKEQLSLLQKDKENLRNELQSAKGEASDREHALQEAVNHWQTKYNAVQKEIKTLKTENGLLQEELKQSREQNAVVVKEREAAEACLLSVQQEMEQVAHEASVGTVLRVELERAQSELALMGELQLKYRQAAASLPLVPAEDASKLAYNSYAQEICDVRELLEQKSAALEAARARLVELEAHLTKREQLLTEQKRMLKQVQEECVSQLSAVESKYQSQRAINQKLEELVLRLQHRVCELQAPPGGGCRITASPVEPSSLSPLAESLGSPAPHSLSAMMAAEALEVKNLQLIVHDHEKCPDDHHPQENKDSAEDG